MLLCDVALGNMYEATKVFIVCHPFPIFTKSFPKAEYVEKLAPGFHSTKGLGKTAPDAANVKTLDGAEVG